MPPKSVFAKRTIITKKFLYCIFFLRDGLAVRIPVRKNKRATDRYIIDDVMSGFMHVCLLNDNAPT